MNIRDGLDHDSEAMIRLIGGCWSEYPGCVLDLETECAYMRAPATHYRTLGGRFVVAEDAGRDLAGCVSMVPGCGNDLELKGLYVRPDARGTGLADALLDVVEREATTRSAATLELWSDTRFLRAHRFYERRGFVSAGAIRALGDLSNSLEYPYAKPMSPLAVQELNAPACLSAVRPLASLLAASPDDSATLGFLTPTTPAAAQTFWRRRASDVAAGTARLLLAWRGGAVAGALALDLAQARNQPHLATVALLLVHPAFRRRGTGHALIGTAEECAASIGRALMLLHAEPDSPVVRLCRSRGWHQAGIIPGHLLGQDRAPRDGAVLWKALTQEPGP